VGKLDRNYSNTGSKLKAADNFAILYIQVCAKRENSYSARPNRSDAVERGTRSRSRNGGSFSGKSLITKTGENRVATTGKSGGALLLGSAAAVLPRTYSIRGKFDPGGQAPRKRSSLFGGTFSLFLELFVFVRDYLYPRGDTF
jgi:hypothetical protein